MNLDMHARGIDVSRKLKEYVSRRVASAFDRFADRIRRVHVRLEDVNGPRGGRDIVCKVRVQLHPRGSLLIAERRSDPFRAVAHAAQRAAHHASKRLARKRGRPAHRGPERALAVAGR